jgi:enamine deaminase RidA (YjgF/YER057c/UK114 family)
MARTATFLSPDTIARQPGFSLVVETTGPGRTVYVAGQLGLTLDGKLAPDFRGQAVQAFENLKAALSAVGAGFDDVVKTTNYLTDIRHLSVYREVRDQYVNTKAPPASTTLAVSQLAREGALFEVEAIAVLPPR